MQVRVSVKRDYSNLSEEPPRKRSLTEVHGYDITLISFFETRYIIHA